MLGLHSILILSNGQVNRNDRLTPLFSHCGVSVVYGDLLVSLHHIVSAGAVQCRCMGFTAPNSYMSHGLLSEARGTVRKKKKNNMTIADLLWNEHSSYVEIKPFYFYITFF